MPLADNPADDSRNCITSAAPLRVNTPRQVPMISIYDGLDRLTWRVDYGGRNFDYLQGFMGSDPDYCQGRIYTSSGNSPGLHEVGCPVFDY